MQIPAPGRRVPRNVGEPRQRTAGRSSPVTAIGTWPQELSTKSEETWESPGQISTRPKTNCPIHPLSNHRQCNRPRAKARGAQHAQDLQKQVAILSPKGEPAGVKLCAGGPAGRRIVASERACIYILIRRGVAAPLYGGIKASTRQRIRNKMRRINAL